MRYLATALFLCLFSITATAQSVTETAITEYVADFNKVQWPVYKATVIRKPVTIAKIKGNELVVTIDGVESNTVTLDRETPAQLDEVLPLTIDNATIVLAGKNCLIVDRTGTTHYAFSVENEPELPVVEGHKFNVFYGYGLGRTYRNTSGR